VEKISYIRRGVGEDLVLMHGYGASKECFLRQINYFSKFYKVTAFDFPGFGKSYPLIYPYSVGDYAAATFNFLNELKIYRPLVIAHSFGARVAVKMAGESDCFKALLIVGGAGIVDRRGAPYYARVISYKIVKRIFPSFADKRFGSKEYKALSPVMRESYKKIVNEDLRVAAQNIKCSVLLVYGKKDRATPVRYGKIYNSAIAGSSLYVMENCGHFAFLDDELKFNMAAEEFFLSALK